MTYTNLRITFVASVSALIMSACSPAATAPETTASTAPSVKAETLPVATHAAMKTKTKAVLIYADWCGSCKILDPKVEAVKAAGRVSGLEFVKLDYTDKDPVKFYAQAKAAGVEKAVKAYFDGSIKTGQLLLVDVDDKKVIGRVTKEKTRPEIVTALKDAVAAS